MLNDPLWAEIYYPNGTALVEGQMGYRPRYADTLQTISEQGIGALYNGSSSIAQNTVKAVQASGGILALSDLEAYEAIIRVPANITYRQVRYYDSDLASKKRSAKLMQNLLQRQEDLLHHRPQLRYRCPVRAQDL